MIAARFSATISPPAPRSSAVWNKGGISAAREIFFCVAFAATVATRRS
jgi:hypothetical protein